MPNPRRLALSAAEYLDEAREKLSDSNQMFTGAVEQLVKMLGNDREALDNLAVLVNSLNEVIGAIYHAYEFFSEAVSEACDEPENH